MSNPAQDLASRLAAFLKRAHNARSVRIVGLRRLTGGAVHQTWSFDAVVEHTNGRSETFALVLRTDSGGGLGLMSREMEYRLLKAAHEEGVPAPGVHALGDDSLDAPFFLMERVEGETIARRLLRDDKYANARAVMTGQLGAILATIHRIPVEKYDLGVLPSPAPGQPPAETEVGRIQQIYRSITPEPHPAFELAFRWLRQNLPPAVDPALVHGDYRIGNVIFGEEGVRSVIDWEGAHIGDPMEDVGWICVRSWRFGNDDRPVGGIGSRREFWWAYEAAGGRAVEPATAQFWEVYGNLRWGVICMMQARRAMEAARNGPAGSALELLAIGRRTAETEWELLNLMEAGGWS